MKILPNIKGHDDLQNLTQQEQLVLCDEIRQFLVDSVSKTGGHLASNLGVVELSVAIETVYNTNKDRLVFDVGHQSYVHKMLTGRQTDFAHLRQYGGMAGFPKPSESDTDAFVAGHASSSVSIALGMARARSLQGENYDVVTVIGTNITVAGKRCIGRHIVCQFTHLVGMTENDLEAAHIHDTAIDDICIVSSDGRRHLACLALKDVCSDLVEGIGLDGELSVPE